MGAAVWATLRKVCTTLTGAVGFVIVVLVLGCARHLGPGGRLIAGFSLDRGYGVADYDRHCEAAGLELEDRWSTWNRDEFGPGADYAVSVHRTGRVAPLT